MRILVTGGARFIRSNFMHYMLEKHPDYEIANLDKLTYAGNLNNLKDVKNNPKYSFIKGDVCDKKIAEKIIKKVDVVVKEEKEFHNKRDYYIAMLLTVIKDRFKRRCGGAKE